MFVAMGQQCNCGRFGVRCDSHMFWDNAIEA